MNKILQSLTFLLAFFFSSATGVSQIIFVAQGGAGDGTSWADATGDLGAALANATSGTQIWVKEGTYYPITCSNCSAFQRSLYFEIKNGVSLYGGFAGYESATGQRNISAHPTYLSGDIDQDGTLANNSFNVVYSANLSSLTIVDGFTITGGNADNNAAPLGARENSGGGWFNNGSLGGNSNPQILNCRFVGNYAWGRGGGMVNDGNFPGNCLPTLTDCVFSGNVARSGGGALYNTGAFDGQCNPSLLRCIFENNDSPLSGGGAVYNLGSNGGRCNPDFTNCQFSYNTAFDNGGAMYNFGEKGNCNPAVADCDFVENEGLAGGAVYNDGILEGYSSGSFINCIFKKNHSSGGDGGAVYNAGYQGVSSPEIINCEFDANRSAFAGAAIFNNGVEGIACPQILDCRFTNNLADTYAGAIYNHGKSGNASPAISNCLFYNNSALSAGAIYNLGSEGGKANAFITNCTFYGNQANVGGAVYCNAGEQGVGVASPTLRNCIFQGNAAGQGSIFRIIRGTPTISYSLVDLPDCQSLYNGNGGAVNCGSGLIFGEDPLFVNAADGDFHLLASSPAIDSGSNEAIQEMNISHDLDGLPRIFNSVVDMGIFEFGSAPGEEPKILQNPESREICKGDSVEFNLTASGNPPLFFQWLKNGTAIAGATESHFSISNATAANAGNYVCIVANQAGLSDTSHTAILTVNEPVEVALSIEASQTEICEGEEITLTTLPINGGLAPAYQWFINGYAFGVGIPTFTINSVNDGDVFSCQMISSEKCVLNSLALSNEIAIHTFPILEASVSIEDLSGGICEGESAVFTAIFENGGSQPVFQWMLNGSLTGETTPNFTLPSAQSGDKIQCFMTSSKGCLTENPVSSNIIHPIVKPAVLPSIFIQSSADTVICLGANVSFWATAENSGDFPDFLWQVNGVPVGLNEPVFSTAGLEDQDKVACQLTSSLECATENPILSNEIVVSVDSCSLWTKEQTANPANVILYPNPASGRVFVEILEYSGIFALRLLNFQGQITYTTFEQHPTFPYKRTLNLTGFPKGIYYLQIISNQTLTVEKIILQ